MRVVIIGAGIVGVSAAYRLAETGAEVICLDERGIGAGTSRVSYAWVNACEKLTSRSYYLLNMAGRDAHGRIAEEIGDADWYPRPGILQWQDASAEAGGVDTTAQDDKLTQLVEWGYPAELIDAHDVRSIEPDISPDAYDGRAIILYAQDGWCHAVIYAGRVAGEARRRFGATFRQAGVSRVVIEGSRCTGVILADGTRIEADVVVNSAGRWFNDVIDEKALRIPLAPTAGLIAYTAPAGLQLRRGLRTPSINLRQDGGGRLLLRAGDIDKLVDGEAPAHAAAEQAEELMRRARALLPALADVPLEASRVAIRPCPADSYSAIGPIPGVDGLYAAVTHSGVTLAPFIGEAIASELTGTMRTELVDFRPARFFGNAA